MHNRIKCKGYRASLKYGVVCLAVLWCGVSVAAWSNLGGGDHGGTNWVIANGTYIASNHYNVGSVIVATGVTAYVQPYSGGQYGWVQITASNIAIAGTLSASGAGYLGGAGGAGGNGGTADPQNGFPGASGAVGGGTFGGAGGLYGAGGTGGPVDWDGHPGASGQLGGYAVLGGQGDTSTNETLLLGSGGGGGGGSGAGWRGLTGSSGGGGGGAGNRGGGYIILCASNSIIVEGAILAKGTSASTGNGGAGVTGGNPGLGGAGGNPGGAGTSSGGAGGTYMLGNYGMGSWGGGGGAGAGGGVLLKSTYLDTRSAVIDNRGGGNSVTNGGTLKVFYIEHQAGSLTNIGRMYLKQMMLPEPGTVFEF